MKKLFTFTVFLLVSQVFSEVDYKALQDDYLKGNYEKVLSIKEKVEGKEAKVFVATYQAYAALALEKFDLAERKINELQKLKVDNSNLHHLRAYLMLKKGDALGAVKDLESLKKKGDLNSDEKLSLLNLYLQLQKYKQANALIEVMSDKEKNDPQVQQVIGYLEFLSHNYRNALFHYKKAIALKAYDPQNYLALESVYGQLSQDREVIMSLKEGLKKNPHDFYLLSHLAYQLEVAGQRTEAFDTYEKAFVVASDKDKAFIKSALRRLSSESRFNSFTRFSSSEDQFISNQRNLQINKLESQSIQQSFEGRVHKNIRLGFDYIQNQNTKKLSARDHEIKDKLYSLGANVNYGPFFASLGLGIMEYDADNIGIGASGTDNTMRKKAILGYTKGKNNFSLSYSNQYEVLDLGNSLTIQELDTYRLQDSYSFTDWFNLVGTVQKSDSNNYELLYYSITPVFYLRNVIGLSFYASLENYDYQRFDDFKQYVIGTNYDSAWTEKFNSSFTLDLGRREHQSTEFVRLNTLHKFFMTDYHAIIIGLGGTLTDNDTGEDETWNASLALNLNF